ncbi:maleylacetate reductase [Mycolicibacterium austroafricanum]|uniref:maleylacetate reductase n=1 Tax=Mycolicibacterium austroafricanum TaxID=39687 RepID=UPI001CA35DE2|nr:maleylacetate reductase [Mycolicibacterium austroafricanum]QZT61498.1 maleylacetate reductase [Mycolicibacterium austroafricanum]
MGFVHEGHRQRVRFATGEASGQLAEEITALGVSRVMVIAADEEADLARAIAGALPVAAWHHEVAMHVPIEVAERARAVATDRHADAVVSVGGGSTTGLAKAVALTTGVPIVAVPTTYAGSEATNVWGLTDGAKKTTGVDERVLPRAIIYDAALTLSLPVDMSVSSGLNALAHCVDSLWAPNANPINSALAEAGIRALNAGLPKVAADASAIPGRELALQGTYLSAAAFSAAGSGLHHKICHVLGGMFNLAHAQTHAIVLPHVLAFNAPNAEEAQQRIARAFDSESAQTGLANLRRALDAPSALRDYGMPESGLAEAVDAIVAVAPASNPTPVTPEGIAALLRAAWEGDEPQ